MPDDAYPFLTVDNLVAGYGKKQVLKGITLNVARGEIVTLIGHNGAGKSTLLKAIFGMIPVWGGSVTYKGRAMRDETPRAALEQGISYVPQGNKVFYDMTVLENLELAGAVLSVKTELNQNLERVFDLFPALKGKLKQRAGTLSGGEKQMLSLAGALTLSPQLLLLDEPSLGLAPDLVSVTLQRIRQISDRFEIAVLIVEQKVREVLTIAQRVYVLRGGTVSFEGPAESLDDIKIREVFL